MIKICIIAPYEYTIPAIQGGALEKIVESICVENEKQKKMNITVLATFHKDNENVNNKFSYTQFVYFKKNFLDKMWFLFFRIIKKMLKKYIPAYLRIVSVKRWLERNSDNFDIFVFEDGLTYMLPYLFENIDRRKIVSHLHWVGDPNIESNKYISQLMPVSEFVGNVWGSKIDTPQINISVVKNGIKVENFKKQLSKLEQNKLRKKLEIDNEAFVVLYIGRIVKEKGIRELLQAIELIESNNIVLLLIGSAKFAMNSMTSYEKEVKAIIDKAKHKIIQLGYVHNDELYKYQNISNIAVIPTIIEEAAPLACVENMAAGLPLIITNSGGMPEYVGKNCSIMVDKTYDLEINIAKSITYLMNNADVCERMSKVAKINAENYSTKIMYDNFWKILECKVKENNENN